MVLLLNRSAEGRFPGGEGSRHRCGRQLRGQGWKEVLQKDEGNVFFALYLFFV